jgi:hypothetical protein
LGRVEERSGREVGAESISTQEAQAERHGPEADGRSDKETVGQVQSEEGCGGEESSGKIS